MPGGDGTGPYGTGGWCTPLWMSGQIPRPLSLGFRGGIGFGRGRGFRGRYYANMQPGWSMPGQIQPTKEQELQYLKEESRMLAEQLEQIKKRIEELKG